MLFSFKHRVFILLGLSGLILCLAGCGTKHGDTGQLQVIRPIEVDTAGEDLNHGEMAALRTTGQIDRNVPKDAMPEIAAQYKYFLRKGRNTMCNFSRRSEQYLAYARKVFRDRGMPEELANLAIVESGYRANAVSRAGAAGAWQFMPGTGKVYGLNQDFWQDDRLDPYKATEAAAAYLQKLHNDFGDWPTAIAAYNAGEGKIARAKAGTGAKDFYEVNALNHTLDEKTQLREETRQYVPRFMAVTKIMRNLPQLGFDPIEPDKTERVTRLTAAPGTSLKSLSDAANMDWNQFRELNQHHKRAITCTERDTFVYVPERVKELANRYLCSPQKASYAGWHPIKITNSRESPEKLCKRANVPLERFLAANPGIGKLSVGQIVLVPASLKYPGPRAKESGKAEKLVAVATCGIRHVVGARDTLYSVAKKYSISVEELRTHNGLSSDGRIKMGAVLAIPSKKQQQKTAGSTGKIGRKKPVYVVQAKDSLWSIAKRHNTTVAELVRLNSLNDNKLRPGSTLVVASE